MRSDVNVGMALDVPPVNIDPSFNPGLGKLLDFKLLESPMQLLQYLTESDLDLIEQAKSYTQRYRDALKIIHDDPDREDDWDVMGSKIWGFGFTFCERKGKTRVHRMHRVSNRDGNHGRTNYVRTTNAMETWDAQKGVEYLLRTGYIDLRESFLIWGTTKTWICMRETKGSRREYAVLRRDKAPLTVLCHHTRFQDVLTGLRNNGFNK